MRNLHTVAELYKRAKTGLALGGIPRPEVEARMIISHLAKIPLKSLPLYWEGEVESGIEPLDRIIHRRVEREPLQLIFGKWDFLGREFFLEQGVFVPRQETEILVEIAISKIKGRKGELSGLEVGSGSGVISVSLLLEVENILMSATDISGAAVSLTRKNGEAHGVLDRLELHRGDYRNCTYQDPEFDLIISNPPYLSRKELDSAMTEVKDHDPMEALLGGKNGLEFMGEFLAFSNRMLKEGGELIFEFGYGQEEPIRQMVNNIPSLEFLEVVRDLAGIPRVGYVRKW